MKKIGLKLITIIMLFGFFGLKSNKLVEATNTEIISVQLKDLTPEQKEAIQQGEPNYEALDGELYSYMISTKNYVSYQILELILP